ncbi:MAG: arginyltransferase [Defluviicoccus sp.]|nr:arginyltransferase [Defluviicoccus sp.]MDG4593584.1 arginyltransferase [Defluviicoccus sp.]
MKHQAMPHVRYFFATAPLPCPYLAGRTERRLVTELSGRQAGVIHDVLSQAGFRRSHGLAYIPICRDCSACAAVRVCVPDFVAKRAHRRILQRNAELVATNTPPIATSEHFVLFREYERDRHGDGEMARMTFYDYQALIEETPVDTYLLEIRTPAGHLVGVCLTDRMSDGLSAVYSFFDPRLARRSLGSFIILTLIEQARRAGLPHVYLGFWIAECQKMAYKARFQPLEAYTPDGWQPLDPTDSETMRHFASHA